MNRLDFPRLAFLSVLGMACSDYAYKELGDPNATGPTIEVEPGSLDFGGVRMGEVGSQTFQIRSVGSVTLELGTITLDAPGSFAVITEAEGMLLDPGDSADVIVTYSPAAESETGAVVVASNDPAEPEALVMLNGNGMYPLLRLDPDPLDFGYIPTGTTSTLPVDLRNEGGETLTVTSAVAIGEGFVGSLPGTVTIEPGDAYPLEITFAPTYNGIFEGELWAESDSAGGTTRGTLRGTSAQEPVAVCSVDPEEIFALYDEATWIGHDSFDPGGERIVDYEWALVSKPTGSSARITGSGADRPGFVADMVGEYMASLVVRNESGQSSAPCYTTLNAIPSQDLWIEMFWVESNDDMDLHLVVDGGGLTSDDDCYYGNCVGGFNYLDWGVAGETLDDPSLDLDDIPGTGPENINVAQPHDGATYIVYVHDYTGSTPDYRGANSVTVNVYIAGELEWTDTRDISGDSDYVPFAGIDWDSRAVSSL